MSKGAYVGVDGVARKVKKMYIGIDGVARKVKKGYIGVDGVARLFFSGGSGVFVTRPAAAMTSNSSQGCVAYSPSEYNSLYAAYRAFDKKAGTQYGWATEQGTLSSYIQLKMDVALLNISVSITNRTYEYVNGAVVGTILGSNDGESWVEIGSFEGRDGNTNGLTTTHECNNSDAYQYVRIAASRSSGGLLAMAEVSITGELP